LYRKRKGGIKLADKETEASVQEDLNSSTVSDDVATEPSKELESVKEQKEKDKADALWDDFLKDVGSVPKKTQSGTAVSIDLFCCPAHRLTLELVEKD